MKKNYVRYFSEQRRAMIKYIIMMKAIWILILVSVFEVSAGTGKSYSQNTKLDIQMSDATLEEVIWSIKEKSEFDFFYNSEDIRNVKGININLRNSTASQILNLCLENSSLTYEIVNKAVIIRKSEFKKSSPAVEQNMLKPDKKNIEGQVLDKDGNPIPGTTVVVKGTTVGTITDLDGKFSLDIPVDSKILMFSFIGMVSQEIEINNQSTFIIAMEDETIGINDVVVVGYGIQKKETVVGAITQINGDDLKQSGGVSNIGQALQGKLPGVTTIYTNGAPGSEDMKIFIRGQSTWNNTGSPLILVDGVERSMNDVDMNEIESISVLKDASATAVYGVKGANGVILLTTKRGQEGKAQFSVTGEMTLKTVSKLPTKLNAFGGIMASNEAIMRELMYSETSWGDYTPMAIAERYRNQSSQLEEEIFPNVDWEDYMLKNVASDYRLNLSVRGGSKVAKYFCNLSYLQENDMFKDFDNGKGYNAGHDFNRFNYRSNLDFNITKTTKLSVNLSGAYGIVKAPNKLQSYLYLGFYHLAPDIYYPQYSDGSYGYYESDEWSVENPVYNYSSVGYKKTYTFRLNSDFALNQDLSFITKGLSLNGKFSFDSSFKGYQSLSGSDAVFKRYLDENTVIYSYPDTENDYAYVISPWKITPIMNKIEDVNKSRIRRINYQVSLNYTRKIGEKHDVGGLLLFKREEYAKSSMFPIYYEDWVGRATYNYDSRYLFEFNGAYNGSEKFGPGYRFELFPSVALGWMISNERFMESYDWLDKLKFRGSYGLVGDDGFEGRWQYISQWSSYNTGAAINAPGYYNTPANGNARSPYYFYTEAVLGNPDLHWETAIKKDIGVELSALDNAITIDFDYFIENREDIVIYGANRSIPDWFGNEPPDANLGKVDVKGFELVVGLNHSFDQNTRVWTNISFTDAKDKVIYAEDPELSPAYQKTAGYPIGQMTAAIQGDMMQSWDDVYMSTPIISGQDFSRIGYYDVIDFDGNGLYESTYDNAPYGYPTRPQNTWSWSFGGSYKNWSLSCQFYGMFNSTRNYRLDNFIMKTHLFFEENTNYWSKENSDATSTLPAWDLNQANNDPYRNLYDASMVRLKMVELSYNVNKAVCNKLGISNMRFYVNGNNLLLWTDMADDRDYGGGAVGAYPTLKRFNFGFNLDF